MKKKCLEAYFKWRLNYTKLSLIAYEYDLDPVTMDRMIHIGRRIFRGL